MKKISLTVKVSFAPLLKENIENEGGGFRTHYNNIPQIEPHAFVTVCNLQISRKSLIVNSWIRSFQQIYLIIVFNCIFFTSVYRVIESSCKFIIILKTIIIFYNYQYNPKSWKCRKSARRLVSISWSAEFWPGSEMKMFRTFTGFDNEFLA